MARQVARLDGSRRVADDVAPIETLVNLGDEARDLAMLLEEDRAVAVSRLDQSQAGDPKRGLP